jgi:hypothetical protein
MMMWWRHIGRRVAEYCDGRLTREARERADAHVAECSRCRATVDEFESTTALVKQLAVVPPPDSLWLCIESALDSSSRAIRLKPDPTIVQPSSIRLKPDPTIVQPSGARYPRERSLWGRSLWGRSLWDPPLGGLRLRTFVLAATALIAVIALGASYSYLTRAREIQWRVMRSDGSGSVNRIAVGELLETDASSRLKLNVGAIGVVDVEPNTRIRLLAARSAEQRLALEHGEITATISAPPRLFLVNTSSSTVVDLGCKYTMKVDDAGSGKLRVTLGWASLEWAGRESLVPAGASCDTRPNVGPGTPSFDDASLRLTEALTSFDFDQGGSAALDAVLAESRVRDTLTLWHLLSRVDVVDRARVYERIVALTPLPSGVTQEKALQLDPDTLKRWREELAWTW